MGETWLRDLPRAVVFGIQGPQLTSEEISFFERVQPFGFILFKRNCLSPDQVRTLIETLRQCVHHENVPILIDQEGGRVARLGPPHWREYPPASIFGQMAEKDLDQALWCAQVSAYLLASELKDVGVTVNCAPVLDLYNFQAHPIVGDRSFGEDPEIVASLACSTIKGFLSAGIIPVIKHLPGHGRAQSDSHEELPIVSTSLNQLTDTDFAAFRRLIHSMPLRQNNALWGMTAHIVYQDIDPNMPATQSPHIIRSVIRDHIGFSGLLISDCLTMKALSGSYGERAEKSLKAGCDVVLHCSGILDEMIDLIPYVPPLSESITDSLNQSLAFCQSVDGFSEPIDVLERQLQQALFSMHPLQS